MTAEEQARLVLHRTLILMHRAAFRLADMRDSTRGRQEEQLRFVLMELDQAHQAIAQWPQEDTDDR